MAEPSLLRRLLGLPGREVTPRVAAREAERAINGDQWEMGRLAVKRRRKDVEMNTEIRFANGKAEK